MNAVTLRKTEPTSPINFAHDFFDEEGTVYFTHSELQLLIIHNTHLGIYLFHQYIFHSQISLFNNLFKYLTFNLAYISILTYIINLSACILCFTEKIVLLYYTCFEKSNGIQYTLIHVIIDGK